MIGPPSGPPTRPPTSTGGFPAAPPPPSSAPAPDPVEPARSPVPKWVLAGVIVFVVCFGLGLGLVLGGDDDSSDGEDAAATDTVEVPGDRGDATAGDEPRSPVEPDSLQDMLENLPEGWEDLLPDSLLDDLSSLGDLDQYELPGGMGSVQISVVFSSDAEEGQIQRVRDAFEGSDLVGFVQVISAEEVAELTGIEPPPGFSYDTLTAFSQAGVDADDARDFACSFVDDPGVETVQVFGADPCGTTT